MSSALVIGKFYPPHKGHTALIEHAMTLVDRVSVVVMGSSQESISVDTRVGWLRDIFESEPVDLLGVTTDAGVDYDSDLAWDAQVAAMKSALRVAELAAPDVVVSSESYGAELARRLDAKHEMFDMARTQVPVSASAVRADLAGCWNQLEAPVRTDLGLRVVVLGSESSGTTTLANALAEHYHQRGLSRGVAVPEHGRQYTALKLAAAQETDPGADVNSLVWRHEDFREIARTQQQLEDQAALRHPITALDTDALATSVWERRYLGASHIEVEAPGRRLYLLTSHDIEWEDDGLREGDLVVRAAMTEWFADALTARGLPWLLVGGTRSERLDTAVAAVERARRTRFTTPIEYEEA